MTTRPQKVGRAHGGALFLDELSEFSTFVLEARVRPAQPWQSWNVDRERARIALADARAELVRYPAR